MLNTLSLRNAKRSLKDYGIFIFTMTMIAALMFAFNGLLFSEAISQLVAVMESIVVFVGMATVFVILIMSWLTKYIINFMLERRGKEFGTYLLIGMSKKQLVKLFRREQLTLGAVTFTLGLVPGYLIHLLLVRGFLSVYGVDHQYATSLDPRTYLLTLAIYFGMYFLALLRVSKRFKKMQVKELLYVEAENEELTTGKLRGKKWVFFISLTYLILFHIGIITRIVFSPLLTLLIVLFFAAIYGLFYGGTAFLTDYIDRPGKQVNKKANLVVLRQVTAKISTMGTTMGTLTILFVVIILSWVTISLFFGYQRQVVTDNFMDVDVLYFSENVEDDFATQRQTMTDHGTIHETFSYNIYQNESQSVNQYLYQELSGAFTEAISQNSYFEQDTYMLASDYNQLREMAGEQPVSVKAGHYLLQGKKRLATELAGFSSQSIAIQGEKLVFQKLETIPFTQTGINGADYLIIVPDSYQEKLQPYYSVLAANVDSPQPAKLANALRKSSGYYVEDEPEKIKMKYGEGSDQLITLGEPICVKDALEQELSGTLASLSFTLGYIGVVFLMVAMSILAIQQLSDASKYRYRYQILKNLGMTLRERKTVILKQLGVFYLAPVIGALLISLFIGLMMSNGFVSFTGISNSGMFYYGLAIAVFLAIFLLYFAFTFFSFVKIVEPKQLEAMGRGKDDRELRTAVDAE